MADRQSLNATFFTLKSRPRMVLLPATVVTFVALALIIGLFLWMNFGSFASLAQTMQQSAEQQTEEQALQLVGGMFGVLASGLLLLIPLYIVIAAYEAACLRWMIRGEAPGLFGITLNADTWRVYGVYWCWLLVSMVVSFAVSLLTFPLMFMSMGAIMTDPQPDPEAMVAMQLGVQVPMMLLQYAVLIFIGVRFSPAAATSVARERFSFFAAWTVTRDRFAALFGAWALLWLIFGVIYLIATTLLIGAVFWRFLPHTIESYANPTPEMSQAILDAMAAPGTWLALGLGYLGIGLLGVVYALLSYGINARAAMVALDEGKIEREPATA